MIRKINLSSFCFGICIATVSMLLSLKSAQAAGVQIKDCTGESEISFKQSALSSDSINFTLQDSAGNSLTDIEVIVVNAATGESITTTAENGVISLNGISSGTWRVCPANNGAATDSGVKASLGTIVPVVLGLGVAGGVAAGIASDGDGSGGSSASESLIPQSTDSAFDGVFTTPSSNSNTSSGGRVSTSSGNPIHSKADCRLDEEPTTVISPFN